MTMYSIKVYLTNGWVGYATCGYITKDINDASFFDTVQEAKDWYYKNVRNSIYDGIPVDTDRCSIVTVDVNY